MNRSQRTAWVDVVTVLLFAFGLMSVTSIPGLADVPKQETEVQQALQKLRTRIEELNAQRNAAQTVEANLEESLQHTELAIGRAGSELRRIKHRLKTQQATLKKLRRRQRSESRTLRAQRDRLRRQLRVAYAMGQQDVLKVLLKQQQPDTVARLMAYHRYVSAVRARQIEETTMRAAKLREVEREAERKSAMLGELRNKQIQTRQQLKTQRSTRQAILSQLRAKIRQDGAEIEQMERDKERLEELLAGIREALKLSDIPDILDQGKPFASLKGKLRWPSRGAIVHRFGTPRRLGALSWKGVWIASPRGQPIRAIWHGRVAFADWLRGFGLLLIIDHGGGYMSLYGHNESLYKEVGDWVRAGELIATVGDSGGSTETGLYFEIRHKGTPQDPGHWCGEAVTRGRKSLVIDG
jgi:septal ring factor EnvC (AmiA/AmiB activator)